MAGRVPAGPPILVLDGIDVASLDHLLPESSRAFARVDPDMMFGECLLNIGNHRRSMPLVPILGTVDTHIVNLNVIIQDDDNAVGDG